MKIRRRFKTCPTREFPAGSFILAGLHGEGAAGRGPIRALPVGGQRRPERNLALRPPLPALLPQEIQIELPPIE
jgi:hypothetical protein